jgi:dTDP-4-dehydrorhamnose reductase
MFIAVIVILGAAGQVGQALHQLLIERQRPVRALVRADCDIGDVAALERNIAGGRIVLNCAAYTAVDRAEAEVELAYAVNASGAANVANE